MQSLWSRAGQAHRCGCRACEGAVGSLGRRASTAVRRRKPTFAEVFTACYSSLFATAAVVDAIRKEDRRQELDRQLEEARRDIAELQRLRQLETAQAVSKLDIEDQPELTLDQMDQLWKTLKMIYTDRPFMREIDKPVTHRVSELLIRMKNDYYSCPDETTMQALRRTDYERLERAMVAEEKKPFGGREALSDQQLHNDSRTIVHLVRQLLDRAEANDSTSAPSPSFLEARELANKRTQGFTFSTINPSRARQNMRLMNSRMREIIHSTELSLKEKVGKVCYNLLISAHPPDMYTYNTLIVAFDKIGHQNLAESLVNSFFYYRRLKPTPSTFVAILNHYKSSNNHGRFLRALACITGLDGETGAKIRRRHIQDVYDPYISQWAKNTKRRTHTGDWIWEHAPLNQPLVEAIINGLLHFKLFDQAAAFFVSCMSAHVALSTQIIRQLFDECIIALDWRASVRLIKGFVDCAKSWPAVLVDREGEAASYLINRLYVLLDLCGLRATDQAPSKSALENLDISSTRFEEFMESLARAHALSQLHLPDSIDSEYTAETDSILEASETRLLQIESLWKEQALIGRTLQSIESKLLYPDFPPRFRRSMAKHIGISSTQRSVELSKEFLHVLQPHLESSGSQRILTECLEFVDSMTEDVSEQIDTAEPSMNMGGTGESLAEVAEEGGGGPLNKDLQAVKVGTPEQPAAAGPTARDAEPLKRRARRLLTWPVPAQRPACSSRGHWVGAG